MTFNLKNRSLHCGFVAMMFCSLVLLMSCSKLKEQDTTVPQKITWGIGTVVLMAPVWVARDKGFFEEFGLVPEWKQYDSGLKAMIALCNGEVQIANCADFIAAQYVTIDPSVRIIASTTRGQTEWIIARRNSGIRKMSDLKGKKVGLAANSSSDFNLNFSLKLRQIPSESVEMVNLSPPEQIKAIMNGEVDAIAVWQPWVTEAMGRLGENGLSLPVGDDAILQNWLLMSKKEFLDKNSSVVERILKALLKAEIYIKSHEEEAGYIVKKYVGEATLENQRSLLTLDRPLLITLETQARWLTQTQPQKYPVVPNFLNFIYFSGLEQVKPERATLSH